MDEQVSKEKDIIEANPILTKPDFKQQLREWEEKQKKLEPKKENN